MHTASSHTECHTDYVEERQLTHNYTACDLHDMTLTTTFSKVSNGHNFTKEQTTDHQQQHNHNTGTQSNLDPHPADVWMHSHKV